MSRYIVACDIGGTFSDMVALDTRTGRITNVKVPSTPPTFIEGVMQELAVKWGVAQPTAATTTTWGRIKSLYR